MARKSKHPGFFVMEDANTVLSKSTLSTAKDYALSRVVAFILDHEATKENVTAVTTMINASRSQVDLAKGICGFLLTHTTEN